MIKEACAQFKELMNGIKHGTHALNQGDYFPIISYTTQDTNMKNFENQW